MMHRINLLARRNLFGRGLLPLALLLTLLSGCGGGSGNGTSVAPPVTRKGNLVVTVKWNPKTFNRLIPTNATQLIATLTAQDGTPVDTTNPPVVIPQGAQLVSFDFQKHTFLIGAYVLDVKAQDANGLVLGSATVPVLLTDSTTTTNTITVTLSQTVNGVELRSDPANAATKLGTTQNLSAGQSITFTPVVLGADNKPVAPAQLPGSFTFVPSAGNVAVTPTTLAGTTSNTANLISLGAVRSTYNAGTAAPVTLKTTYTEGTVSRSTDLTVNVKPALTTTVDNPTLLQGQTATITATLTGANNLNTDGLAFAITGDDGTTPPLTNPTATVGANSTTYTAQFTAGASSSGNYTVRFKADDTNGYLGTPQVINVKAVAIDINPATANVNALTSQDFTVIVHNATLATAPITVDSVTGGGTAVIKSGPSLVMGTASDYATIVTYTAPNFATTPNAVTLTVKNTASGKTKTATITVPSGSVQGVVK